MQAREGCYDVGNVGGNMRVKPRIAKWRGVMALTLAVSESICYAQQQIIPPTDTDLKAAYCIAVEQAFLGNLRQIWPGIENAQPGDSTGIPSPVLNSRDGTIDELKHLQRYMLPRTQYVDAVALREAMAEGKQDWSKVNSSGVSNCTARCVLASHDSAAVSACVKACDPDTFSRLWSCNDLSWLPF